MLQLVPVLSMFFLLTSAAGSALWAVQLEKQRRMMQAAPTRPSEVFMPDEAHEAHEEDAPPPYSDEPSP